jgi:hypothetical protein
LAKQKLSLTRISYNFPLPVGLGKSSPEYWSVLCTSTTNFWETGFGVTESTKFKRDLEQNTFSNLTLASKINLWKNVEIVQYKMENQKRALSPFCQ